VSVTGVLLVVVVVVVVVLALLTVAALVAVVAVVVRGVANRRTPGGVHEVGITQGGGR
jgi:hypothetical protein